MLSFICFQSSLVHLKISASAWSLLLLYKAGDLLFSSAGCGMPIGAELELLAHDAGRHGKEPG